MKRRNSQDSSKFVLPNGISTNGHELKTLQHKLLQNYYQMNTELNKFPYLVGSDKINDGKSSGASNRKYDNMESKRDQYLDQYFYQQKLSDKRLKNQLSHDLQQQINFKRMKNQEEKRQIRQQEHKLVQNTRGIDSLEREKERQFKIKYREEAKEDLEIKQTKRKEENVQTFHQKQYYRNRYLGQLPRSQSLGNLSKQRLYVNPTQLYCYEIDQAIKQRNNLATINPQNLTKSSSYKVNHQEKMQNMNWLYGESLKDQFSRQQNYYQSIKEKEIRQREDLKETLLSQIKQKNQKMKEVKAYEQVPYASRDYKTIHHPINNPVDFKYAHDNQYVISELKSLQ